LLIAEWRFRLFHVQRHPTSEATVYLFGMLPFFAVIALSSAPTEEGCKVCSYVATYLKFNPKVSGGNMSLLCASLVGDAFKTTCQQVEGHYGGILTTQAEVPWLSPRMVCAQRGFCTPLPPFVIPEPLKNRTAFVALWAEHFDLRKAGRWVQRLFAQTVAEGRAFSLKVKEIWGELTVCVKKVRTAIQRRNK
jgi:hypothetical protein